MARRKEPRIPDHLLDQLLAGAEAKSAFAKDGLLDELKKALAERALNAEMDHHLAGEGGDRARVVAGDHLHRHPVVREPGQRLPYLGPQLVGEGHHGERLQCGQPGPSVVVAQRCQRVDGTGRDEDA